MLPTHLPEERPFDRPGPGYTPAELHAKLQELLEAQTLAGLRGYDLVAKLYACEWQMLFLRYVEALQEADRHWDRATGYDSDCVQLRRFSGRTR